MSKFRFSCALLSRHLNYRCLSHCDVERTRIICNVLPSLCTPFTREHATISQKEDGGSSTVSKRGLRAVDLAKKLRYEKEKQTDAQVPVSPLQRRVSELRRFSKQLQSVHPNVLAKALYRGLVFQNQNLVVINKPYGVPVYDAPGIRNSIVGVMPVLAKIVAGMRTGSQLHVCHALDKETTGILLLARSEEIADNVQRLFKAHQVERKYWAVTVGVPVPSEGVIDIPIIEREVVGPQPHFKMGLSPAFKVSGEGDDVIRVRSHRQAQAAVTQYRVLDSSGSCSLVELQLVTGIKHQLRVHMAHALGCPILGDHKYAHWTKLAPQKLPEGVLGRLGLEQSKARYVPLHLHARQLTVPGFKGQPEITVSCPLPKFFTTSLHRLKISLPDKS
ncbi:pseudouridylate synthase RPUSD4, mitochondrial [Chanos chanos]|uniref:Pseudouridylate synthase RPUSD4, mitochondrial n=1 Tax=Chanos chanos TaxID=29144 RepID=A0A6J2VNN9_CHACN|nr:mitochondrial RNA pseudouridine synthase rpusd4-like [Chanos chanos]